MTSLIFSVGGTPRPKARPRFVRGRVITTASDKEKLWRMHVRRAVAQAVLYRGGPKPVFTGPVRVRMVFTFTPPPSARGRMGKPHTQKPDADNLAKLVLDAMEWAGVFPNDSLAAETPVEKWWGERAGVVVTTEPIDAARAQAPSAAALPRPDWL